MQSGLRSCPHSEALWVEYLRMELTYLNKLSARRAALGEDVGTLVPDLDALPSSFSLRTQFLEILEATDLANSENMQNEILADMKNEFSKEPAYWDWLEKFEAAGVRVHKM
ncbi:hypothetical protein Hanom_Chr03g00228411 [Helianthus anomalus]